LPVEPARSTTFFAAASALASCRRRRLAFQAQAAEESLDELGGTAGPGRNSNQTLRSAAA
jgi:hypothetical protein